MCERAFQELKRRLTSAPILIVLERGQRYMMYCDASKDRLGCVFDAIREGCGLWFSVVEEPRAKLPHTWYGVGGHCLCFEDSAPLPIR